MKTPLLLKNILDFCFYLLILFSFVLTAGIIYNWYNPDDLFPVKINEEIIDSFNLEIIFKLILLYIFIFLFMFSIYFLRKLVNNFTNNEIFSAEQELYLRNIGIIILCYTVLSSLIPLIVDLFLKEKMTFYIGFTAGFGSFWFLLALGLFFIYLSKVFRNARLLKEENDYTV